MLVGESLRTNRSGIHQLKKILNYYDVKVIPIALPKQNNANSCFHLMSLVSMLDHDLAIGCLSSTGSTVIVTIYTEPVHSPSESL